MRKIILLLVLSIFGLMSPAISQVCPDNIDFENGNTSIWHFYTGTCCPISATTATSAITNRHTLQSGTTTDPFGGFPIVAPGGGSYSLKLGNSSTGSQAEKARYYVHVPSGVTNYALLYRFAVVLQDPSSHTSAQKPRFEVTAIDSATGVDIPCSQYSYVSTRSLGWDSSTRGVDVFYKPWSTASINLSGTGGTTVIIDFSTGDCILGGHFGYAYIDMNCGLFTISNNACDTSSISLSAPPGYDNYEWYDSATFATVLDTGQTVVLTSSSARTFAVVLTPISGYGCPDTLYTHVNPSALTLHPTHDTSICFSSGMTLTSGATDIVGPLTYAWTSASPMSCDTCANPVITPTASSTYYVTVTNPYGCTKTDSIHVIGNITTIALSDVDVSCYGMLDGQATATITSNPIPLTYAWSTFPVQTAATAYGLGAGVYTLTISDTNGCTGTFLDTISGPPPLTISFTGSTGPTTCDGADGTITIGGLVPGARDTLQYRHNGVVTTVIGNASSAGTYTFTGLNRGVYDTFKVITGMCPYNVIGPITLTDPAYPPAPMANSNSPLCAGDTVRFVNYSAGAGITYFWSGPRGFVSVVQNPVINNVAMADAGVYYLTVSRNNCRLNDSVQVVVKPAPVPSLYSNSPICVGDTVKLFATCATAVDRYQWAGPNLFSSTRQNPVIITSDTLASGIYTVTLTRLSCSTIVNIPFVVNGIPSTPVTRDTAYCQFDLSVPLTATGLNLRWYLGSISGAGLATSPTPGTYLPGDTTWFVSQTSPAGCTSKASPLHVKVVQQPQLGFLLSDSVLCVGSGVTLTATNSGETYTKIKWQTGDGDSIINYSSVVHSYMQQGLYTIKVSTDYPICGVLSLQRDVKVYPNPQLNLGPDTFICSGSTGIVLSDNLNGGNGSASWLWGNGETSSSIVVTVAGTYYLKVKINGCETGDSVVVADDCYIDVPNAFSPNGDGLNETFLPRPMLAKGLKSFQLRIFDRWGQEVFNTNHIDGAGWDGKYNNIPQPQGVYIYMIEAVFMDGGRANLHGNLTLLR